MPILILVFLFNGLSVSAHTTLNVDSNARVISACKHALTSANIILPSNDRKILFTEPLQISMLEKDLHSKVSPQIVAKKNAPGESLQKTHDDMLQVLSLEAWA